MNLPFNVVVLETEGGEEKRMSVEEFCAIPLADRVRALLEKKVTFYQDQARVDQQRALNALRRR